MPLSSFSVTLLPWGKSKNHESTCLHEGDRNIYRRKLWLNHLIFSLWWIPMLSNNLQLQFCIGLKHFPYGGNEVGYYATDEPICLIPVKQDQIIQFYYGFWFCSPKNQQQSYDNFGGNGLKSWQWFHLTDIHWTLLWVSLLGILSYLTWATSFNICLS